MPVKGSVWVDMRSWLRERLNASVLIRHDERMR